MTEPWRKVKFWGLVRLCDPARPLAQRWTWRKTVEGGRARLGLVSAHGRVWDFRLNHGAWLRPVKDEQKTESGKP